MPKPETDHPSPDVFRQLQEAREKYTFPFAPRETGCVTSVSAGIVKVSGLPGVGFEELLKFSDHLFGIAYNIDETEIGVILLGEDALLNVGDEVERTHRVMDIPVGDALLGRIINPLGEPEDGGAPIIAQQRLPIERTATSIMDRAAVAMPLQTGIKVIDALIPIGRGQRELILGDRQTGKTAIAIDTIINQAGKNVLCVYCAIGQRASSVAKVIASLKEKGAMAYTVVVVTEGNDPPGLKYIAPYAATSIAEYFMEQGRDVLIVYDDLTHHARAYRELSLLLRRPPGREAFPGDIFYIHSRLLERSTHLSDDLGGGSLTALPIIETEAQNIAAYIPTNLISITDGQIYLSPKLFELGILPAVDVGKSVSRVGGKAQLSGYRSVTGNLKLAYAQFEELENYARFGTRLDEHTRKTIEHGKRIRSWLVQHQFHAFSVAEQIVVLLALTEGYFDTISVATFHEAETALLGACTALPAATLKRLFSEEPLREEDKDSILDLAKNTLLPFEEVAQEKQESKATEEDKPVEKKPPKPKEDESHDDKPSIKTGESKVASSMPLDHFNIQGLTSEEVHLAREEFGQNTLNYKQENGVLDALRSLAKEPMVFLLLIASLIYFVSGKTGDGIFLTSAIIIVSAISLFQDSRSRNALQKLKTLTQPNCKVIRNGEVAEIQSEELVVGDSLIVEEGTSVTADGMIVHSNDFSVDESILTGESLSVFKDKDQEDNFVYKGTTVSSGLAIVTIKNIGNKTKLGKIGKSLESIQEEKTPLEIQINSFVKKLVIGGALVFLVVWAINYFQSFDLLDSLLKALTLAMSILPEEVPMAFSAFMAIGAWRLMQKGIVVKQMKTVETLGSATVICTDKTGTITENKMSLAKLFILSTQNITSPDEALTDDEKQLITIAMWASEPLPFDPMEVAVHDAYANLKLEDERPNFKIVHEYPLGGKPPMMTHVFENNSGKRIIAAKGAPEALLEVCNLTTAEKQQVEQAIQTITSEGYRVLGVGESDFEGSDFPELQQDISFVFKGIVGFYDPPKKNINKVLEGFYQAGIAVKIITGDNAETTTAIAKQIDFKGFEQSLTGDESLALSDAELEEKVKETNIFTRMFPEAKLRIINALKANNQIVAMTGDGVNDGPALKAAHIGIAMGKKGTEIAKQAASLILMEDDLSKMVDAVAMGRRIYANLKKAIQYIISIHIPIILTVFIPLTLGWIYPNIFSPVHIIFLELIMGPTCSIVFENEPMEKNVMSQKPRPLTTTFFNWKELTTSIIQGLVITAGTLFAYQYSVYLAYDEALTRTIVFLVLIAANIFLTLVNRSFYYSVFTTMRYKNNLVLIVIAITSTITGLLLFVPPLTAFFEFEQVTVTQFFTSIAIGFVVVFWYELVKIKTRLTNKIEEPGHRHSGHKNDQS